MTTWEIHLQRVYDAIERGPGRFVLVDRVWPRGMRKQALPVDTWLRELGTYDERRKWFGHRPERWPEFQRRYRMQLGQPAQRQLLNQLVVWAREGSLTALYGARDKERNQAVVLRSVLEELLVSWEPLGRSFSRPWASLAWVDRACAVALQSRSFRYKTMVTAAWRARALERWPLPATSGTAMSAPWSGDSHPRRAEAVPLPRNGAEDRERHRHRRQRPG